MFEANHIINGTDRRHHDSMMNRIRKVGQDALKIGTLACSVNRFHLDDTDKSKQGYV